MDIKVLGPGCPKCKDAEKLALDAVRESGVEANVEKVSDLKDIMSYGVFSTPAVVIDGVVKSVGKVPSKKEFLSWIKPA
ncbi:thioredoxin family protein [Desulfovibrio sulfodismutans]|uniref:Thioredoxin family protein n=1 Tax=Desulfolutivibrio sulfodismutans TaxID=63561 RepID=A0A7K3NJT9_9BACT|nr:thioredoxin family protein [Desulfolutivibrio sulfodismutans]NDY56476.1 thioredoxin family protein [Desulfolutivibrio sulfodismutans]QLA12788.1 thioredoxin family protein [Desulfolutivibrio sulfodismutans DSM 3696]